MEENICCQFISLENNLCYRSGDNTMQIQGECIVRNNFAIAGGGSAFASQSSLPAPFGLESVEAVDYDRTGALELVHFALGRYLFVSSFFVRQDRRPSRKQRPRSCRS